MSSEEPGAKRQLKPTDGKQVMFTRVDAGFPDVFTDACAVLSEQLPFSQRRPAADTNQARQLYAFEQLVYWVVENHPDAFLDRLSEREYKDPDAVRAALKQMGLASFAAAVPDAAEPVEGKPRNKGRR